MSEGGLEPAAAACLFPPLGAIVDGVGGVVLFARDIERLRQLEGLLVAVDEEGGDVTRLEAEEGSSFPGNLALGAVDDVDLTRRVGAAIGGELAAAGVNFDLAPVADVIVDPANAIVGVRSFGSDPALVSRHVAAFVEGVQSVGVAACAKHFPGHGESIADSHLELPTVETDRETLRGFMLGIPPDLEEASQVDGTTRFGAFLRILLPLIGPGLVATSIFAFIQAWNEYIMAYVLLHDPSKQTLTVWLASFTGDRGTAWGPLMAGATLTALPVVIFFVAVQRRIAFGLTAGAVRG